MWHPFSRSSALLARRPLAPWAVVQNLQQPLADGLLRVLAHGRTDRPGEEEDEPARPTPAGAQGSLL
jgi:hypothetical protein